MEMPRPWKSVEKQKQLLPLLSTVLWKSRKDGEISTLPQPATAV